MKIRVSISKNRIWVYETPVEILNHFISSLKEEYLSCVKLCFFVFFFHEDFPNYILFWGFNINMKTLYALDILRK